MSVLLFCHSLRRMGLSRKWLTGCSKLYLTLIFSVLSANICGAFSVYKTTSADNTRSSVSDQQRRLRDIHTSQYMVKDILSDYLEDDSNTDQGGDVILRDLTDNPDMKSDYPDAFQMDDATRAMELQETESPLYSRLIKVILQEDVQSPDVTIVRQKRPCELIYFIVQFHNILYSFSLVHLLGFIVLFTITTNIL